MLSARTQSILETSVRDFIKNGEPITSEGLFGSYEFGIKPAMIRWELSALNELGYLAQIHSSSGRVPTAKAYKFFVSEILDNEENSDFEDVVQSLLNDFLRNEKEFFIENISKELKVLGVGYETENAKMYNSGLKDLIERCDLESKDDLVEVVRDFEFLGENIESKKSWWLKETSWPKVFVGKSPITKCKHLSVFMEKLSDNDDDFMLIAIGPKRMDYEKSLGVFKLLKKNYAG